MELRGDLALAAGSRVSIWLPANEDEVFGPGALAVGQGFTLDAGPERWRAVLVGALVSDDGTGVSLELELTDSTPAAYGPTQVR